MKSIRKSIGGVKSNVSNPINKKNKSIQVNHKGRNKQEKKKNNLIYLKQRYSHHYKKNNWEKAEEYNQYSIQHYNTNLRDWMEEKELSKSNNKNAFGFDKPKRLKYG